MGLGDRAGDAACGLARIGRRDDRPADDEIAAPGRERLLWRRRAFLIVLPYLGVLAYLLTQGGGMAERQQAQAQKAREEIRHAVGFSAADELKKLDELKAKGSITEAEYGKMRAKLI